MLTKEEKAKRAEERKEKRQAEKDAAKIQAEKNQKPVKQITITIEWSKSRTWGSNPHASAAVEFADGTYEHADGFTCSGCEYDKEITVIAEIFNKFLRYRLWEIEDFSKKPYGICLWDKGRYYSGGIGTSCYNSISVFIGGEFTSIASGKGFDVFVFKMK